jgi:hypothetical protein
MYGNKEGVFSATMKLINRASVNRTISKQEAMCLLGQQPLILCSERNEHVSLSTFKRISTQKEPIKDKNISLADVQICKLTCTLSQEPFCTLFFVDISGSRQKILIIFHS